MRGRRRDMLWIVATVGVFLVSLGLLVQAKDQNESQSKPPAAEAPKAEYEILAKGVVASPTFRSQFKSAPLRLEFRNWVMGPGETETIPIPTHMLMELRQGSVTTNLNQSKQERRQGDLWEVEKGSALTIQNPHEVAVIRAIYVYENSK